MKSTIRSRSGFKSASLEEKVEKEDLETNQLVLDLMIRETFEMFDEDGSGDIDKDEFSKLAEVLGLEIDERKQKELMRELDNDGSGSIGYEEFVKMMSKFQFGNAKMHLESAFNEFDKDMDGEIGLDDLVKVSEELEEVPMSKSDAAMLIAFFKYFSQENEDNINVDNIKNFNITKEEFITTLTKVDFLVKKEHKDTENDRNKMSGYFESGKSGNYTKSLYNKSFNESKTGKSFY